MNSEGTVTLILQEVTFTLLNTGQDASESGARYGLLGAVESLITNVFLPTIETQSWNTDKTPQSGSDKTELVNSLSSFVHVLTSM